MAVQLRYSWLLIMLCLVNMEDRLSCYGFSAFSVSLFRVFSRLYCRTESPLFIFFLCFRGNVVIVVLVMLEAVFFSVLYRLLFLAAHRAVLRGRWPWRCPLARRRGRVGHGGCPFSPWLAVFLPCFIIRERR